MSTDATLAGTPAGPTLQRVVIGIGEAAVAGADSLIVTFRPIASGPAELKVSSLLLQGDAGGTIAHEPPAAFRAAILQ